MRNIALLLVTMTAGLFVTVGVALAASSAPTNETTSSAPTNETTSSAPAEEVTSSVPVDETTSSAPTDDTTTVDTTTVDTTDTTGAAEERVIELESRPTALRNFVDVEGDGPSPGDIYVFRNKLFDGQGDTAE